MTDVPSAHKCRYVQSINRHLIPSNPQNGKIKKLGAEGPFEQKGTVSNIYLRSQPHFFVQISPSIGGMCIIRRSSLIRAF